MTPEQLEHFHLILELILPIEELKFARIVQRANGLIGNVFVQLGTTAVNANPLRYSAHLQFQSTHFGKSTLPYQ